MLNKNLTLSKRLVGIFCVATIFSSFIYVPQVFATSPVATSISTCQQLQDINNDPTLNYKLTSNIDCAATSTWNSDGTGGFYGFLPISNFSGKFYGQNYTIDGLYINRTAAAASDIALFHNLLSGSLITNLHLTNENITGYSQVAGLAGEMDENITVSYVTASGTLTGYTGVGGLIGFSNQTGGESSILNSSANFTLHPVADGIDMANTDGGLIGLTFSQAGTLNVTESTATLNFDTTSSGVRQIGGLIGNSEIDNGGTLNITGCSTSGTFTSPDNNVGGLIGRVYSEGGGVVPILNITGSHSDVVIVDPKGGSVGGETGYGGEGVADVGGLVGIMWLNIGNDFDVTMSEDYFSGSITGFGDNSYVGGLVGRTIADHSPVSASLTVEKSYNAGTVSATSGDVVTRGSMVGGIIGEAGSFATEITNVYSSGNINGDFNVGGIVGDGVANLTNVYSNGTIESHIIGGGLVGEFLQGSIVNSFTAAQVNGNVAYAGAIVGRFGAGGPDTTFTNDYYDQIVSTVTSCANGIGDVPDNTKCTAVNTSGAPSANYFKNNGGAGGNAPLDLWSFPGIWTKHASSYPDMDIETQAPILSSPVASTTYRNDSNLSVSFTLPESISSGSLTLTFIPNSGDSSIVINLADVSASSLHTLNLPTTGGISSVSGIISTSSDTIPVGKYRVKLSYQDVLGNVAKSVDAADVFVDSPSPVLTEVQTIGAHTTIAGAVYHFTASKACDILAEPPTSTKGAVELQFNSGHTTGQLIGIQVGGTYSFRFTCRDTDGNNSNTLEAGPYTVIAGGTFDSAATASANAERAKKLAEKKAVKEEKTASTCAVNSKSNFVDINNHWAKPFIEKLYSRCVVKGKDNDHFSPDDNISRAEFIKMVLEDRSVELKTFENVFKDVKDVDWFAKYIVTAYKQAIVAGYNQAEDLVFKPNNPITRAEAIKIIIKINGIANQAGGQKFADVNKNDWYSSFISTAVSLKIIQGYTVNGITSFKPDQFITRAEAAKIIELLDEAR